MAEPSIFPTSLLVVLFAVHADINNLQDVMVGTELKGSNINLDVVPQKVFSELTDIFGPSCTPHKCLSVRLGCRTEKDEK